MFDGVPLYVKSSSEVIGLILGRPALTCSPCREAIDSANFVCYGLSELARKHTRAGVYLGSCLPQTV